MPFPYLSNIYNGLRQVPGWLGDEGERLRAALPPGINGKPNPAQLPRPQIDTTDAATLEQVRRALPQGINGQPNPATLPRPVAPVPVAPVSDERAPAPVNPRPALVPPLPPGIPGGGVPDLKRPEPLPTPQKNYGIQRLDYQDAHAKRGFKEILKGGLYGMAMNGGQGGLGGLLGGFTGGAVGQAVAPREMARARFEMGPGRRILADEQMQRENELYGLKVRGQQAQIAENEAQAAKYGRPVYRDAAWGTYNEATGQPGYTVPPRDRATTPLVKPVVGKDGQIRWIDEHAPDALKQLEGAKPYKDVPQRPIAVNKNTAAFYNPATGEYEDNPYFDKTEKLTLNEALGEREALEGDIGSIAADSLAGREEAILNQLTPREREVLAGNAQPLTKTINGQPTMQNEVEMQREYLAAKTRYEALKRNELSKITRETRAKRYSDARADMAGRRTGARPARPGGSGDDAMLKAVRANPQRYADQMRANGASEEQIAAALRAAGVQKP